MWRTVQSYTVFFHHLHTSKGSGREAFCAWRVGRILSSCCRYAASWDSSLTMFVHSKGVHLCHLWTRWWFQVFFIFIPIWGNIPNWLNILHMGWNHQLVNSWVEKIQLVRISSRWVMVYILRNLLSYPPLYFLYHTALPPPQKKKNDNL